MSEPEFPPDDTVEVLDVSELIDAHLEAQSQNDFENEIPTVVEVRNICLGCGGEQYRLDDTEQPPASHEQAWRPGPKRNGKPTYEEGACRGNRAWFWCRVPREHANRAALTIMPSAGQGQMDVLFFPDRRLVKRPVAVERRGLPRGKP